MHQEEYRVDQLALRNVLCSVVWAIDFWCIDNSWKKAMMYHHVRSIYDYCALACSLLRVCSRCFNGLSESKDHDLNNIISYSNCILSKEESLKALFSGLSFSFCGYHFIYTCYYGLFWTNIKDSPTHFFDKTF